MTDAITELLAERAKTHGDYRVHARVTQRLKHSIRPEPGYVALNESQMEAIDMIFHKIGRVIAGNANFKDHWDDIAGYAKLVANQCPSQ